MAMYRNPAGEPSSIIEVETSVFAFSFLKAFYKPQISIDGTPSFKVPWGITPVAVAPGPHSVDVWVRYGGFPQMGRNGVTVDVAPGGSVRVAWKVPTWIFRPGKITAFASTSGVNGRTDGGQDEARGPVGWHADRLGRHQERYFDGMSWTDRVRDGGQISIDPLGAQ